MDVLVVEFSPRVGKIPLFLSGLPRFTAGEPWAKPFWYPVADA